VSFSDSGAMMTVISTPSMGQLLTRLGRDVGRHQQRDRANGRGLTQAGVHYTVNPSRQQIAVHVRRSPAHRVPGNDVFTHRSLSESRRRVNLYLARP